MPFDALAPNPLNVLTFIVAPAILTNASTIMVQGTSSRFARAIDRTRILSAQAEGKVAANDPDAASRLRQLGILRRRVLLMVRALTAFYVAVGAFGAASLVSLLGAILAVTDQEALKPVALGAAFAAGTVGVGGLVAGSAFLVWESRLTLRALAEETEAILQRHTQPRAL